MLEVGQWVWALNENLVLSVKSFIVENKASLVYDSKVGRGWVYLISLCRSGLLKLNQGIGPGREDLKAGFRVKWQWGPLTGARCDLGCINQEFSGCYVQICMWEIPVLWVSIDMRELWSQE